MSSMPVVLAPSRALRTPAAPIPLGSYLGKHFIERIFRTLRLANRVGISGPVVGIPRQLIALEVAERHVLVNPAVVVCAPELAVAYESCVSCPGIQVQIGTPEWVAVEYNPYNWVREQVETSRVVTMFSGLEARVVAHELDHLRGRLITDYVLEYARTVDSAISTRKE